MKTTIRKNIGIKPATHTRLSNEARMQGKAIYKFADELLSKAVKESRDKRLGK